jgi:hypothetical protein
MNIVQIHRAAILASSRLHQDMQVLNLDKMWQAFTD